MLKSNQLLFVGVLVAFAPIAIAGRAPQQAASAPVSAQTPAPTPGASAAPQSGAPAAPAVKNPVKPTAESQAKAKQLYSIDCAMCHNDNGDGKSDLAGSMGMTLANFSDPLALADKPDSELFGMIRNGKDKMPGEDPERAKDDDIWNLVIYVRGLSKPPVVYPAAPAAHAAHAK